MAAVPTSKYDPYADASLLDPWPGYRQLRSLGPAVWLPQHEAFALTRYESVRRALRDWETFSSAYGVGLNDVINQVLRGNTVGSDGAEHDALRRAVIRPLRPHALEEVAARIRAEAERLVERLVPRGGFDVATELAQHLPLTIVSELVGLPEDGRERMLDWASGLFNSIGPANERTRSALPVLREMAEYAATEAVRGKLKPGSWAEALHDAADRGEVPREALPALMIDYMGPSLDTTIYGISSAVWLFAQHPEQWKLVRNQPDLIPAAVNEALRMEAPIQGFTRFSRRDYDMDGVTIPAGSRTIVFFGAANRDEREFVEPDRFDIARNPVNQLAFGTGPHVCLGVYLARLEMSALLAALARKVERIELGAAERALNNVLRGFTKLEVTVS